MNLSKNVKVAQVLGYSAAGTAAKTSAVVDMQGFAGVMFVACLGAVTNGSNVSLKAQQDTVNPFTNAKDLSGANASFVAGASDSNKCVVLDLYRPTKRYIQAVLSPTVQNTEILSVVAVLYQSGQKPTIQDATVKAAALAVSPSEV
jgi:hypothetical protein